MQEQPVHPLDQLDDVNGWTSKPKHPFSWTSLTRCTSKRIHWTSWAIWTRWISEYMLVIFVVALLDIYECMRK